MNKKILLSLILFIFAEEITSQQVRFGQLSVENGLSDNVITCVLQDHLGFLWFGTEADGLNRFDGNEAKIYRYDPQDSNSISDNGIWALFEDHFGFLWIGTNRGGLNRYDYRTDKFEHLNIESRTVSGRPSRKQNRISSIYEDRNGALWIGTYRDGGLYRFNYSETSKDPFTNFKHWQHQSDNFNSLSDNYVHSIVEDDKGNIWIGTSYGLNKFNAETPDKPFDCYYTNYENPNSLSSNYIWSLCRSVFNPNVIWICTSKGLTEYNTISKLFSRIKLPESNMEVLKDVGCVFEEVIKNEQILWCSTPAGLVKINFSTGRLEQFIKGANNNGLCSDYISDIIKDNSGVLWITTLEKGVNYLTSKSLKFNNLPGQKIWLKEQNSLYSKQVESITQSLDGTLWFGGEDGLYSIRNINKDMAINPYFKSGDWDIWSLAAGNYGSVWLGTYGNGLWSYDFKNNVVRKWIINNSSSRFNSSNYNYVRTLLQDSKGMLWVGFYGAGLVRLNPQTGDCQNWKNKENDPNSLSSNDVWSLCEDKKGRIWIGTYGGGLNLFEDIDGGRFYSWLEKSPNDLHHKYESEDTYLSDNTIFTICEASKGDYFSKNDETVLWLGTGGGLNKFVIKELQNIYGNNKSDFPSVRSLQENLKVKVACYTRKDGLPNNIILSALEDEDGNLWLGTSGGLSLYNCKENSFTNYTTLDGLNGNNFFANAAYKTPDGIMFFGTGSGLNVFNPKEIHPSEYSPPVLITGFQIFNRQVTVGKDSPLKTNISLAKEIILSYNQNVFTFQFSSLDFNSPQANQYAYMMEGLDKDWIYNGTRQFVTYTNLGPGTYVFKVKATNSDGVWSKNSASLRVIINPPWWKTTWAYLGYIFLIIAAFFGIFRFQISRTELRNELKMKEFEAKKKKELENLKSRFFTNLFHEFRTPLMLVKGPAEQLISNQLNGSAVEKIEQLKMILRNSQKLQELIDQLLEMSRLEAASIPLKAKQENLIFLLCGIVSSFQPLANEKNITLIFKNSVEKLCAWIDREKFEKIINNLLSNALKYTREGGLVSIDIGINKITNEAEIKIKDTGIGIPPDRLDKIFDRFYQIDDSKRRTSGGSGIGLALVKELIELHNWEISVRSEIDKGTAFTVMIPLGDYLEEKEKVYEETNRQEIITSRKSYIETEANKLIKPAGIIMNPSDCDSILIIEDSKDVRKYLSDLLNSATFEFNDSLNNRQTLQIGANGRRLFRILEAENGEEGLKIAAEEMPDLIISDIMMPVMDGIEFCKRIKMNWETSHIPVVLLTAKASGDSKIEGLETGADDYLTKPFESKELFVRVKNLLEQRKRLIEKYSREIKITPQSITTNSLDSEFLNKAIKLAEINLANPRFDSEAFAKEMFVSRSQLHRKLKAITGLPTREFLTSYRLKKAAQMLLEKRLSITQIALEVGFSSHSHFTKAFHRQFDCLPSEFAGRIVS